MRVLFFNIRGFGRSGRRTLIKDLLRNHKIDIVCLQETIKQDFTDFELQGLEVGENFYWCWLPAVGHSGGMLLGLRDSVFEVESTDRGQYFLSANFLHRPYNFPMTIIGVYGPANHSASAEFLDEISAKVASCRFPILMGGDFNLLRGAQDKNNDRLNWARIEMFNDHISSWALREMPRSGASYTWSNKQLNPVRCVLDRVFIAPQLDNLFPLASLVAETSLGSDHTPLIFNSGEDSPIRSNRFFFETGWFEIAGFREMVQEVWIHRFTEARGRDIVDWWNHMSVGLRQHLRGWSRNMGKEARDNKRRLVEKISGLDLKADSVGLDEEEWAFRYHLEAQLLQIYSMEEEYWR